MNFAAREVRRHLLALIRELGALLTDREVENFNRITRSMGRGDNWQTVASDGDLRSLLDLVHRSVAKRLPERPLETGSAPLAPLAQATSTALLAELASRLPASPTPRTTTHSGGQVQLLVGIGRHHTATITLERDALAALHNLEGAENGEALGV